MALSDSLMTEVRSLAHSVVLSLLNNTNCTMRLPVIVGNVSSLPESGSKGQSFKGSVLRNVQMAWSGEIRDSCYFIAVCEV